MPPDACDAPASHRVVVKGGQGDDAVLCTQDKTYALKYVETTNTLLLLPPDEARLECVYCSKGAGIVQMKNTGAGSNLYVLGMNGM